MTCGCSQLRPARCKSCGATILWTKTASGASMPLDSDHAPEGRWRVVNGACVSAPGYHVAHWATCLNAAAHRSPQRSTEPRPAPEAPPSEPPTSLEAPGGPEIEFEWMPSEGLSLSRRIARLVVRDQSLPREERRRIADLVARCEAVVVNVSLVELRGDAMTLGRLAGHMQPLRDAAACCVAATWPEHQALELSLGELAETTTEAAA